LISFQPSKILAAASVDTLHQECKPTYSTAFAALALIIYIFGIVEIFPQKIQRFFFKLLNLQEYSNFQYKTIIINLLIN
jgi:hypothetical protein